MKVKGPAKLAAWKRGSFFLQQNGFSEQLWLWPSFSHKTEYVHSRPLVYWKPGQSFLLSMQWQLFPCVSQSFASCSTLGPCQDRQGWVCWSNRRWAFWQGHQTLETWAWTAALRCLTEHKGGHLSPLQDFKEYKDRTRGTHPWEPGFQARLQIERRQQQEQLRTKGKDLLSVSDFGATDPTKFILSAALRRWCYQALKRKF